MLTECTDTAGLRNTDGRTIAHADGCAVHGLTVGNFCLVFQAHLGVVGGLLKREVMAAIHGA